MTLRLKEFLRGWRLQHRMGNIVTRVRHMSAIAAMMLIAHIYVLHHVYGVTAARDVSLSPPLVAPLLQRGDIVDRHGRILAMDVIDEQGRRTRVYPQGALFAHLVGATNHAFEGVAGVEHGFNARLERSPEPLRLTVDSRMQYILHEELTAAMNKWRAAGAAAVLLDARHGFVRAFVSLPDFNPHHVGEVTLNRVSGGLYEMGSVFKLFVAAMVLEEGGGSEALFDGSSDLVLGKHVISAAQEKARFGRHSLRAIVAESLNVGAARAALQMGGDKQRHFLDDFAMLSPLPAGWSGGVTPLQPKASLWHGIHTATIAYGYGLAVTPLHMAAAVAAMVNGGIYHPPSVVMEASFSRGGFEVMSAKNSERLRSIMRSAVTEGTGKKAHIDEVAIGGKTGTARKVSRDGYDDKKLLTSFVAAFPIDAPRYVLMVLLDEPQARNPSSLSGGSVAAPIAARMIRRLSQGTQGKETRHERNGAF